MVLKRKLGNEWVAGSNSSIEGSGSAMAPTTTSDLKAPDPKRAKRNLDYNLPPPAAAAPIASSSKATPVVPPQAQAHPMDVAGPSGMNHGKHALPPPVAAASPKKGKSTRKKGASDVEKRGARFRVSCPKNILERLERVRTQTFFMVDRRRNDGELREEFSVLGSTGNVYTIVVDKIPSCDCPDAGKGNHCKHILFVMTKVLQVPDGSNLWYQKALLTTELESIFASAPAAPNAVTNRRVQEAYARATGQASPGPSSSTPSSKKRMPGEDDDCPICYETMHGVAEAKLVFCEECGNALHTGCFQQWKATTVRSGNALTCVWCRSKWAVDGGAAGGSSARKGNYLNLAGAAGLSPARDTSSYYHGPRRGERAWQRRVDPYLDDD